MDVERVIQQLRNDDMDDAVELIESMESQLASLLSDWNAVRDASGSPTNGALAGYVALLRRDAERYRWVAKAMLVEDYGDRWRARPDCWIYGETLDEAVDAAISASNICLWSRS